MERRIDAAAGTGTPSADTVAILAWRFTTLLQAGYGRRAARALAARRDVDLHRAVNLLERGCPVATAVRILL